MMVYTRSIQKGFSLIELMIVIAILGIVAAIGIPAYGDYIIRAKISGMINSVDTVKQAVSEYRGVNGNLAGILPDNADQTFINIGAANPAGVVGNADEYSLSDAISSIQFAKLDDNAMAIAVCGSTVGQGTTADDTVDIYFTGVYSSSGMRWACAYEGGSKYVPSSCRVLYDPDTYGALNTPCVN